MGQRGPLRMPTSRRGEREARKQRKIGVQPDAEQFTKPEMPGWLPEDAKPFWTRIVESLEEARVPLERCDSEAVAMYGLCVFEAQKAANFAAAADVKPSEQLKFMAQVARFNRDAMNWAGVIGATP